jgi:hypothetical protein
MVEEVTLEQVLSIFLRLCPANRHTTIAPSRTSHHLLSCATALARQYIVESTVFKFKPSSLPKLKEYFKCVLLSLTEPNYSLVTLSLANRCSIKSH